MNPFLRFFIRFLKIFVRSLFRAAVPIPRNHDSSPPQQDRESHTASKPAQTETTTEPPQPRKHRRRRTSVTETTTRTTTISESQSSPELTKN